MTQRELAKDATIAVFSTSALLLTLVVGFSSFSASKQVLLLRNMVFAASAAFLLTVFIAALTLILLTFDQTESQTISPVLKGYFVAQFVSFMVALILLLTSILGIITF